MNPFSYIGNEPVWTLDDAGKSFLTATGARVVGRTAGKGLWLESIKHQSQKPKPLFLHDNDEAYNPIALGIGNHALITDMHTGNPSSLQGDTVIVATANYENFHSQNRHFLSRYLHLFAGQTHLTSTPSNTASWYDKRAFASQISTLDGNAILPTGYASQKLILQIIKVISQQKYETLGDFYLALQKKIHKNKSANGLDNLIFFGNGAYPMPNLDLSEFNFDALADMFPEEFGYERSSQTQFDGEFPNHQNDPKQELVDHDAAPQGNYENSSWSYYWPVVMQRTASLASFWYILKSKQKQF